MEKRNEINFDVELQPIQMKLLEEYEYGRATKIGFGGSRGGSKSFASDILMLYRRLKYAGTTGLFVMRIYQDMLDIHILPLFEMFPELRSLFNQQNMILKLPNMSYIRFLSGDSIETLQERKGRGYTDVIIDQSEMFSEEEIMFLYTLNRSSKAGVVPKTLLCFNPGGLGHSYHKRVFVDRDFRDDEDPEDYAFIKAVAWDNGYWCIREMAKREKIDYAKVDGQKAKELVRKYHKLSETERFEMFIRTDYGRTLNQLPEHRRRAELYGDMDIFEGMFFEDFRREHHVIDYQIDNRRITVGGLDYGNKTVLTILQIDSEGTVVLARECYLEETNPTDRAIAIADFIKDLGVGKIQIIYDTDMDISQISNVGYEKTPIEIFRDVFEKKLGEEAPILTVVNKVSLDNRKTYRQVVNDVVKDYLRIRYYCAKCMKELNRGESCVCGVGTIKKSKLYIDRSCTKAIRFFSEAIYDKRFVNDFVRKTGNEKEDHVYDSFKYALMWITKPTIREDKALPKWMRELQEINYSYNNQGFMGL